MPMVAIAAVGDNVVDCYPAPDRMYPGGNALNVSVFARRGGALSSYVGAVAADPAGLLIRRALIAEGVNVDRLRVLAGETAFCVIGHRDGDRVFLSSELGVSRFEPDEDDLALVARHDAVHVSASSGLDHRLGEFASLLPLSYDFSTHRDAAHISAVAPHCFLASLSGGDLTDTAARNLAAHAVSAGARWALVTRGADGALLMHHGGSLRVAARPGTIVDTLGAGDTFIARVLVGLVAGEALDPLLADAADRAAATCENPGAFGYGERLSVSRPETVHSSMQQSPAQERNIHD
jgi:fructoselysine 6-kinase